MIFWKQFILYLLESRVAASKFQNPVHLFMEDYMAAVYQKSWENVVLPLAYEAEHQSFAPPNLPINDRILLKHAYAYCDSITSTNSRTFYLATSLLPAAK